MQPTPIPPSKPPALAVLALLLGELVLLGACARLVPGAAGNDGAVLADGATGDGGRPDLAAHDGAALDGARLDGARRDGAEPLDGPADVAPPPPDALPPDALPPDALPPDALPPPDVLPLETPKATSQHDTCQNPLEIDVGSLPGGSIEFIIDTSGASSDFAIGTCSPFPDVVVAIHNAPAMRQVSCVGGSGNYAYGDTNYPACTAAISTYFVSNCNGGSTSVPNPAANYVMVFCRDPNLGPARIRFSVF